MLTSANWRDKKVEWLQYNQIQICQDIPELSNKHVRVLVDACSVAVLMTEMLWKNAVLLHSPKPSVCGQNLCLLSDASALRLLYRGKKKKTSVWWKTFWQYYFYDHCVAIGRPAHLTDILLSLSESLLFCILLCAVRKSSFWMVSHVINLLATFPLSSSTNKKANSSRNNQEDKILMSSDSLHYWNCTNGTKSKKLCRNTDRSGGSWWRAPSGCSSW